MEKTLRVLGGEESSGHSHSHSHSHSHPTENAEARVSGVSPSISHNGLRSRSSEINNGVESPRIEEANLTRSPSKLSAYLNLFGDFVHNMSASWILTPFNLTYIYLFVLFSQHRWPCVCVLSFFCGEFLEDKCVCLFTAWRLRFIPRRLSEPRRLWLVLRTKSRMRSLIIRS